MTTSKVIAALNGMKITAGDEDEAIEKIDVLCNALDKNKDGHLACEALVNILERHPGVDFGGPGAIVHTLENYDGCYEELLIASLEKKPAAYTLMLYNRIINAMRKSKKKRKYVERFKQFAINPGVDKNTKNTALEYYAYQQKFL